MFATAHLINWIPTQVVHGKTPYEVLFGAKPSFTNIRVFGCLCYAYDMQRKKDKFGACSRRFVMVGYPYRKKGWKVYDTETKDIFVSRDIIFHEDTYPFASTDKDQESVNIEQCER